MNLDAFRIVARGAIAQKIAPRDFFCGDGLFSTSVVDGPQLKVTSRFVRDAEMAALHRDPDRWSLLYRLIYRRTFEEPSLFHKAADPDVRALALLVSAVRRDIHKMHAFVRFGRSRDRDGSSLFVAFHEPDHRVAEKAVPLFVDRFGRDPFVLSTPDVTLRWDRKTLHREPGFPSLNAFRQRWPEDEREPDVTDLFGTYFASVFNPARLNERMMKQEMPTRFWKNMPETRLIPQLVASARERSHGMVDRGNVATIAVGASLPVIAETALGCSVCPHSDHATAVPGDGPQHASIVLIGEQPGDEEDRAGKPFIGPAGRVLREVLADVGLDPRVVYMTNAVKHFTWEERGKKRIHKKPSYTSVKACQPLLVAELQAVRPRVIVCLGATAAQSLLGAGFRLQQARDKLVPQPWADALIATYHPSAVLRASTPDEARAIRAQLTRDLLRAMSIAEAPDPQ